MPEETIIQHCAPTLAGLKTANLFSYKFDSEQELTISLRNWNRTLSCKGIRMIPMRKGHNRVLLYVYRPGRLSRDLSSPAAQKILVSCG